MFCVTLNPVPMDIKKIRKYPLTDIERTYIDQKIDKISRSVAISVSLTITHIPIILIGCLVFLDLSVKWTVIILSLTILSTAKSTWSTYQYKKKLRSDLTGNQASRFVGVVDYHFSTKEGVYFVIDRMKYFVSDQLLGSDPLTNKPQIDLKFLPASQTVISFNGQSVCSDSRVQFILDH
ncbi:MAG: hypothetical protein B6244_02110 [Candidatus Cloacimonetes bacterium 4572_55]|nr:MAG: hypothetical protein B6244_02110 [Candidatus Cloacimonetes bacterium 4572_55]